MKFRDFVFCIGFFCTFVKVVETSTITTRKHLPYNVDRSGRLEAL